MPRKTASGADHLRQTGRSPVWVTYTPAAKKIIRQAAAIADQPMSEFVANAGLAAAKKLLKKSDLSIDSIDSVE